MSGTMEAKHSHVQSQCFLIKSWLYVTSSHVLMCILHLVLLRGFGLGRRRKTSGQWKVLWNGGPPPSDVFDKQWPLSTPKISLVFELDYYSYLDSSSAARCSLFYGTFEGSLPCSQYLATELHQNPAESNPHSYIYLPICEYFRVTDVH